MRLRGGIPCTVFLRKSGDFNSFVSCHAPGGTAPGGTAEPDYGAALAPVYDNHPELRDPKSCD